jgi:pyruvate dehydrogenase E2 component (dihydrolipoamide acetyltransferase)
MWSESAKLFTRSCRRRPEGSAKVPTEVRLPQEGMAMQNGTITQWFKSVGDPVTRGEPIAEAEAEKASFVIEAPVTGVVTEILVWEGEEVPVRTVLALIALPDEGASGA